MLPSCSHTAISAQPGVQRIGEPKMLLNQFICTESPVLVQWYSAGVWCMVSPTPGKMASPSPSPSCDVVRWPGAARAGLHHHQCPQLLQTQPGGHLQSRQRTRAQTRGHVSRHADTCPDTRTCAQTRGHLPSSAAVGEYSDEFNR